MNKYDTNQNGTIELEEFVADHNVSAERLDKKMHAFHKVFENDPRNFFLQIRSIFGCERSTKAGLSCMSLQFFGNFTEQNPTQSQNASERCLLFISILFSNLSIYQR